MRRPVQTGLLICGAVLLLLLGSGLPVRAEEIAGSPPKIAKPQPVKTKTTAHPHKVAEHHQPVHGRLAERTKPVVKKPIVPTHPTAVASNRPTTTPIIRVNARPAPRETATADRLAASIRGPALIPAASVTTSGPAANSAASDFVTNFLHEAFRIATTMDNAPDERRTQLATLMTTQMDLSRILVYATHAAYQTVSAEMQQRFRLAFASFLAEAYTPRIKLAAQLAFITSPPHLSDGGIAVSTTFTKPGYPASTIDWQLEPSGNSFKIVDVGSEGVSLLEIQRSSFTSVMLNDGGMQGLLSKMDARTRELASAAK